LGLILIENIVKVAMDVRRELTTVTLPLYDIMRKFAETLFLVYQSGPSSLIELALLFPLENQGM
jgi:hypothetical protein